MATLAVLGGGHVGLVRPPAWRTSATPARRRRGQGAHRSPPAARNPLPRAQPAGAPRARYGEGATLFTTSYARGLRDAAFVFVCLPTPTQPDGDLDVRALHHALDRLRRNLHEPLPIVVNKSTVPVGTGEHMRSFFAGLGVRIVSNPEFLAEGRAVEDFFRPSRIVIGAGDRQAAEGSNAFLAMKVSFANALARLSEAVGADVEPLSRILALDSRIGTHHLSPGLGFGGSFFPKDVAAIEQLARRHQANADLFAAVLRINREQRRRVVEHLSDRLRGSEDGASRSSASRSRPVLTTCVRRRR